MKQIQKILIANRGEIARRIVRTCNRLQIQTVVLLLPEEHNSPLAKEATQVVTIDPYGDQNIFLDANKLVQIALKTQVCAIHPGFGFLSENAEFAQLVRDHNLIFIGPQAKTIEQMGLKDQAKLIAQKAEVPTIPGSNANAKDLTKEAQSIGFPLLIKACAGGGGKGLIICEKEADFNEALSRAQSESLKAFNNDHVLLEKLVQPARHIEVQIFGDSKGNHVHLFERDCSLQRRRQKIIEEAPSNLDATVKTKLYDAALKLAKAVNYENAGTVEFLVDQQNQIYFLEMNTRLQVEHTVTEEITGFDLVEWQIQVAQGQKLPATQKQIQCKGHAIEARIYSETPHHEFFPSLGTLHILNLPQDIRVEHNLYRGLILTPQFDPMLAKVISFANTRQSATNALLKSLTNLHLIGLETNISFLKELLQTKEWNQNNLSIDFIENYTKSILWNDRLNQDLQALGIHNKTVFVNGKPVQAEQEPQASTLDYAIKLSHSIFARGLYGEIKVHQNSETQESIAMAQANQVVAPLPGKILKVFVKESQNVKAGDALLILEAMKMQHTIKAHHDQVIKTVPVQENQTVKESQLLVEFKE